MENSPPVDRINNLPDELLCHILSFYSKTKLLYLQPFSPRDGPHSSNYSLLSTSTMNLFVTRSPSFASLASSTQSCSPTKSSSIHFISNVVLYIGGNGAIRSVPTSTVGWKLQNDILWIISRSLACITKSHCCQVLSAFQRWWLSNWRMLKSMVISMSIFPCLRLFIWLVLILKMGSFSRISFLGVPFWEICIHASSIYDNFGILGLVRRVLQPYPSWS